MEKSVQCFLTEDEYRMWLIGFDAASQLIIFLQSDKSQFDKDYLIKMMLESYEKRMVQELTRFKSEEK
ncbi:hypothetical protein [Neobacillus sp. PS3-40]|uniref:hypothetical protein n=1 Tax=Neobacillus sp. PS3-40 TaxID=3070679 RepID=UPI0027E021E6|nr:hypothetical protein [Neobacillus sp. PS3-40]WML42698.1 hypothetical protein RCG20_12690 [Neobacillus sp. PS3-40]